MKTYATSLLWRQSHPWFIPASLSMSVLLSLTPWGYAIGVLLMGGIALALLTEWWARWQAIRRGYRARFWVAAPPRWVEYLLQHHGYTGPPLHRTVWEVHAQDQRHWPGRTPKEAAHHYRTAYTSEFTRLITERPPDVTLICTTFNHLLDVERTLIAAHHGWWCSGALHPALPHAFSPLVMRHTQRRMFGGVVSNRVRTDAANWVIWVIP